MVIVKVASENPSKVTLVENNDVMEALAADRADESLDVRRLPGRPVGNHHLLNIPVLDAFLEERTIDAVAITNQEAWGLFVRKCLHDLLTRPRGRGIFGDIEVDDMPPMMTENNEGEQYTESSCRNGKEVDRDDVHQVIVEECPPGLRRWLSSSNPVPAHGCLGHRVSQQRERGLDARDAPARILA